MPLVETVSTRSYKITSLQNQLKNYEVFQDMHTLHTISIFKLTCGIIN